MIAGRDPRFHAAGRPRLNRTTRLALGSVAIGLLVLGLKDVAWRLTGSVAL